MRSTSSSATARPTNVLVLYGTTEGQTRKIARFIVDQLAARDHQTTLIDAAEADLEVDPRAFGAA